MGTVSGNNILIVGAAGMLGRALAGRLRKKGQAVAGVWRNQNSHAPTHPGAAGGYAINGADPKMIRELFEKARPVSVINCAAYSDVDGCERDPERDHASNALLVKYLALSCSQNNIPLVHVSTDYVFDGRKSAPYTEKDPTAPVNIYGLTKLEGEYYALGSSAPSAVVRTSWLFGAGNPKNFVNYIVERLRKENIVSVLDDQVDSPTYVEDLSEALEKISTHLISLKSRPALGKKGNVFHVCNTGSATRYEMTLKIKEWLSLKDVQVQKTDKARIPNRDAIRHAYGVMSTAHYCDVFRTRLRSWEEALRAYLNEEVLCAS